MTMNLKKVFTSTSFNLSSVFYARFCAGSFYQEFDECRTFLLYKKKKPLTRYLLTHQQLLSCFVSVYYSVLQRFICFQHSPWYGNNHPYQCLFLPWYLVFGCPKGTQSPHGTIPSDWCLVLCPFAETYPVKKETGPRLLKPRIHSYKQMQSVAKMASISRS